MFSTTRISSSMPADGFPEPASRPTPAGTCGFRSCTNSDAALGVRRHDAAFDGELRFAAGKRVPPRLRVQGGAEAPHSTVSAPPGLREQLHERSPARAGGVLDGRQVDLAARAEPIVVTRS